MAFAILLLALSTTGADTGPPSMRTVLERAADWVDAYRDALPAIVGIEHAEQVESARKAPAEPRAQFSKAEIAWVRLPGSHEALCVRDVYEVDGRPVPVGRARLHELLERPLRGGWQEIKALLDESARHNLAPGSRNFNLPTVVAFFLERSQQERFKWDRRSSASAPTWTIRFRERGRPTVISTPDRRTVLSRGEVDVEVATGRIVRTRLELEVGRLDYALETWFDFDPVVELMVPVRAVETYVEPNGRIDSSATYGSYRRYRTGGRIVPQ